MTITYPLTLPAQKFARVQWDDESAVPFSRSPFSFSTQVQNHTGQARSGTVSWPTLLREDKAEVISFIRKLKGPYGTFLMGSPGEETPRGSASTTPGTPLVDGASQTGSSLNIKGAPASVNGYLEPDDTFQLGSGTSARLYYVLNTVNTDSIGDATIDIWPDLRSSPADNATVTVSNAVGLFRMADHTSGFNIQDIRYTGLGFAFVEAI